MAQTLFERQSSCWDVPAVGSRMYPGHPCPANLRDAGELPAVLFCIVLARGRRKHGSQASPRCIVYFVCGTPTAVRINSRLDGLQRIVIWAFLGLDIRNACELSASSQLVTVFFFLTLSHVIIYVLYRVSEQVSRVSRMAEPVAGRFQRPARARP